MNSIKSVLIIDDDEDDVFLIQDRLADMVSANCSFVSCSDKQGSINLLKERTFDLCILDYRLAGYEGLEILEGVADAELATPIIMLTGQKDEKVAKKALKNGAQDFVMKSAIDDDIFEKSVQYAIARKELEFARVFGQRSQAENVAKDKFIAHLSHELRTPLTSILGYTSLLLEKEDTAAYQNELKIISNNGKHLLNLLNDILDLSKIAANKFELKESPTDLQQLLVEVNSLLSVSAIDKGLSLEFSSSTLLPQTVNLDDVRLKQVMVNLIGNAVKFTDIGFIKTDIALEKGADLNLLNIQISDTGIGMANHQIDSIFSPFTQIEDVANRKAGGAGLGLSITAEIVNQMGGKLEVKSEVGKGSTFTLSLPCNALLDDLIDYDFNLDYSASNIDKTPQLRGRVLVVDDVFEIRQLAGYFIKQTGVDVVYAHNGQQALSQIAAGEQKKCPFDLIFMDLHMPVLTGEETVKILRKQGNTSTVIAMTAAVSKGLHEDLIKIGFNQLISKPIDKLGLWNILESSLCVKNNTVTTNSTLKDKQVKPLIHLVEDDVDSATIMQMMLRQLGYDVVHSATAKQAIEQATDYAHIRLHIVDLGLPDMQGKSFLEAFFEAPVSGKVIILSGNQPDESLLKCFPIANHVVKPIDKDSLSKILNTHA